MAMLVLPPLSPDAVAFLEEAAVERRAHVTREGYTPEHDDGHRRGELAMAAACYAADHCQLNEPLRQRLWPWDQEEFRPKDARRNLVRAASLLIAEAERLARAELAALRKAE